MARARLAALKVAPASLRLRSGQALLAVGRASCPPYGGRDAHRTAAGTAALPLPALIAKNVFFRPCRARSFALFTPRLAPWATFLRRFAALPLPALIAKNVFFRPCRARLFALFTPRLAPWATFLRRFAALPFLLHCGATPSCAALRIYYYQH